MKKLALVLTILGMGGPQAHVELKTPSGGVNAL
jgi:hypothetical protein